MSEIVNGLLAKRTECESALENAKARDYSPEIEAEVAEYKATVVEKYEKARATEIQKQTARLELLGELIAEENDKGVTHGAEENLADDTKNSDVRVVVNPCGAE